MKKLFLLLTALTIFAAGESANNPTQVGTLNRLVWDNIYGAGEVNYFTIYYWDVSNPSAANSFQWNSTATVVPFVNFLTGKPNGVYGINLTATGPGGTSGVSSNYFVRWWGNKPLAPRGLSTN